MWVFAFGVGALLCVVPAHVDASDARDHFRAPAFSNPDKLAPMPKEWLAIPVKHSTNYPNADLVIALGQQSHPIFKDILKAYASRNNLRIVITEGTCGITAGKLRSKSINIGAYCCPPGEMDRLPGLEFHSLGIAPIALIVHPDNPLGNITTAQARQIFQGINTRWPELLKPSDKPLFNRLIQPVGRLHCKIRPGHWRLLLKNSDMFSPRLFEVGVIPDMISRVARNPRAIGYESPLMVDYHRSKGIVKMLKINGHPPAELSYVLTGKYPLYRTYHMATWKGDSNTKRLSRKVVTFMRNYIEEHYEEFGFLSPSMLKKAGWRFKGNELIGEPVH